jgi:hypothetical protein
LAFTQSDLDAIEAAIKSGTFEVQFADRKVRYRTLDEMMRIRDLIKADVTPSSAVRRVVAEFSKGDC